MFLCNVGPRPLSVKCGNVERGCTWVGTVGTLEEHVAMCRFALLPCPRGCKDGSKIVKQFMRKDLDNHLKEDCLNRDYVQLQAAWRERHGQGHDSKCSKSLVACPKDGCSEKMQRQQIQKHIDTKCQHATVSCKYISIGCTKKLKRKDMAAHEQDDTVHLHMALDKINSLQERSSNGEPIKFRLRDYEEKKDNKERVQSPSYYTYPNGYHMAIRVYPNGHATGRNTHVAVYAVFLEGRYDSELEWPFIGDITLTLLNQLEDKNHYQMMAPATAADNRQVGTAWGKPQFIPLSALGYDPVKKTQYLKDDTLYFRMSVKPANHKSWLL